MWFCLVLIVLTTARRPAARVSIVMKSTDNAVIAAKATVVTTTSSSSAPVAPIKPARHLPYTASGPTPLPPEPIPSAASSSAAPLPPNRKKVPPPAAAASSSDTPRWWDRESPAVQRLLGTAEPTFAERCCPTLTWEERLMGFIGCFAIGLALSLSSIFSFPALLLGDPSQFAWKYSVGNVLGLASSAFLVGPKAQLEQMASPVRIFATLAYLGSICVTVVAALFLRHALLTLVAIFVQFCALAWYCASYIPFGRMLIRQCVGRVCCPV